MKLGSRQPRTSPDGRCVPLPRPRSEPSAVTCCRAHSRLAALGSPCVWAAVRTVPSTALQSDSLTVLLSEKVTPAGLPLSCRHPATFPPVSYNHQGQAACAHRPLLTSVHCPPVPPHRAAGHGLVRGLESHWVGPSPCLFAFDPQVLSDLCHPFPAARVSVTPFQALELNAQPWGGVSPSLIWFWGAAPPSIASLRHTAFWASQLSDAPSPSRLLVADDRGVKASECAFGVTAGSQRGDPVLS